MMEHKENHDSDVTDAVKSQTLHEINSSDNSPPNLLGQPVESNSPDSSSSQSNIVLSPTTSRIQSALCILCQALLPTAKPAKPCVKCHSVTYCSRECQKADFKRHKKSCATAAQAYAHEANFRMESRGSGSASRGGREGHRGGIQKWQYDT
ncbi:hypothetical protein K3495_g11278 [Podosphaera aphanis]|nr:hypothetical protein K3495_g11278 [Podosphaera aphanis]